jgi:hypothetical protein
VRVRIHWTPERPDFVYPILPAPPTAILIPVFRSAGSARVFKDGWSEEAANFAPSAIAGTRAQFEKLSGTRSPSLRHALIVFGYAGEFRLSDEFRDRLWREFRVPVFEQIISKSGELLAFECEAHDGLHVVAQSYRSNGMRETSGCACGRTTPRVLSSAHGEPARQVAAYAR